MALNLDDYQEELNEYYSEKEAEEEIRIAEDNDGHWSAGRLWYIAKNYPKLTDRTMKVLFPNASKEEWQAVIRHANGISGIKDKHNFFYELRHLKEYASANFLDVFTDKIRELALGKYKIGDFYYAISEATKNPEYLKDCDKIWQDMWENKQEYLSVRPTGNDNHYMRGLFPEKSKQLDDYVDKSFEVLLESSIRRRRYTDKISSIVSNFEQEKQTFFSSRGDLIHDLIDTKLTKDTDIKKCLEMFWQINERPDRYLSSYNNYPIQSIAKVIKANILEDWMYPVMIEANRSGSLTFDNERMPSERTLFDCCKMWKLCPEMPQRMAKFVGSHGLYGRIVAASIFENMCQKYDIPINNVANVWAHNKELQMEFYERLAATQEMSREEVLNMYPVSDRNKKRMAAVIFLERGIDVESDRFRILYKRILKQNNFNRAVFKASDILRHSRFASDKELAFALDTFGFEKIADSNIFQAQQRVMNVLVSQAAAEEGIPKEESRNFRTENATDGVKNFVTANDDWLLPASFKAAQIFGAWFPSYLKKTQAHLSTHDAVYWLPEPMSASKNESFSRFLQNNILYDKDGKTVIRPLSELQIIANNWNGLSPEEEKGKYKDILACCMSKKYTNQRDASFASEAAKHGVDEYNYHNFEDIYLAGLKVPEPFDSKKRFQYVSESGSVYTGRFLPRDDVRVGFFGDYTDCCQHFSGVGRSCAISTVKEPYSQLFVIENSRGEIVAGSWTWENTEGQYREVCFDNIEAIGEFSRHPMVNAIYEQVGNYLTQEQNCRRVTIGLGYQDANTDRYNKVDVCVKLPKLYGAHYSDAHSQVLLAENIQAEQLDRSQESLRYIRDVCFSDVEAMDRVADRCFPESDQQLQVPDKMSGLVIEDKEKGVVGYCLYDKEAKEIYDMAVLPEYRTDKNASSQKLFAELMRVIKQEGGEWHAELRDSTTYKYLKIMAERGVVTFEDHGLDHVMSDGSKVYKVSFEAVKDENISHLRKMKNKVGIEHAEMPQNTRQSAEKPLEMFKDSVTR